MDQDFWYTQSVISRSGPQMKDCVTVNNFLISQSKHVVRT